MHGYLAEFRRLSGVGPSLVEASAGLAPEMLDRLSKSFGTKVTAQDVRFIRFRNYKGGLELEDEAERLGGILTSFDGNEEEVSQLKGFLKKHGAKPMAKSESFDPGEQRAINEDDVGKVIFQQLGGNRIMAMLGRKTSVLTMKNGLMLKWPAKEKTKGNCVRITLQDDDTYKMEFLWVSKDGFSKSLKTFSGVMADGLRHTFESWTGLRLSLGTLKKEENGAPVIDESDVPGAFDKFKTGHNKLDNAVGWLLGKAKRAELRDGTIEYDFRGKLPRQMTLAFVDAKNKKVLTFEDLQKNVRYTWEKGDVGFTILTGNTLTTQAETRFMAHDYTVPASKEETEGVKHTKGPVLKTGSYDFHFGAYAGTVDVDVSEYDVARVKKGQKPPVRITVYVDKDVFDAAELEDDLNAVRSVELGVGKVLGLKVSIHGRWHPPHDGRGMINTVMPHGDYQVELTD